jgi:hypothetical protein
MIYSNPIYAQAEGSIVHAGSENEWVFGKALRIDMNKHSANAMFSLCWKIGQKLLEDAVYDLIVVEEKNSEDDVTGYRLAVLKVLGDAYGRIHEGSEACFTSQRRSGLVLARECGCRTCKVQYTVVAKVVFSAEEYTKQDVVDYVQRLANTN